MIEGAKQLQRPNEFEISRTRLKSDAAEVQTEQYKVDWCKVKNIIVTDDDVTYN
jgi:hypothetical protein